MVATVTTNIVQKLSPSAKEFLAKRAEYQDLDSDLTLAISNYVDYLEETLSPDDFSRLAHIKSDPVRTKESVKNRIRIWFQDTTKESPFCEKSDYKLSQNTHATKLEDAFLKREFQKVIVDNAYTDLSLEVKKEVSNLKNDEVFEGVSGNIDGWSARSQLSSDVFSQLTLGSSWMLKLKRDVEK